MELDLCVARVRAPAIMNRNKNESFDVKLNSSSAEGPCYWILASPAWSPEIPGLCIVDPEKKLMATSSNRSIARAVASYLLPIEHLVFFLFLPYLDFHTSGGNIRTVFARTWRNPSCDRSRGGS
jgi:hypothetical protein